MNIRLLFQLFRIASVMCYIGHGVFGFITKQIWCNYFAVFGIGESLAYQLMPWVGFVDVALGVLLLVYPLRIAAGWLVFWGIFTALLRPLAGEPFAEFIERAGNFGAPFILLLLSTPATGWRDWFRKLEPVSTLDERRSNFIVWSARVFGFLLLAGHGWLNLLEKKGLIDQYISLGIANRGFERRFELADFVRVENADLADGLLIIDLVREIPDAMKPKKIAIGGTKPLEIVRDDNDGSAAA